MGRLTVAALVLATLAAGLGAVVYLYGGASGPSRAVTPSAPVLDGATPGVAPDTTPPETAGRRDVSGRRDVPDAQGARGEPWFGIPGCTCHSDDPVVVEEHRRYTLSECADCH